ncbi:MAG TPA: hypothetical protein GXX51_00575 [Firmicutes bacterium]|nr:hypothetical protein [Bacillota bacterium]
MAVSFSEAPEVQEIAEKLIEEYHDHLKQARIKYLFRSGNWTAGCKTIWAKATKLSAQQTYLTGFDFVITVNRDIWAKLTVEAREALVDHELSHCSCDYDPLGRPIWRTQGHEVEDFADVIRRHGLWSVELEALMRAAEEYRQLALFEDRRVELRPTGTNGRMS